MPTTFKAQKDVAYYLALPYRYEVYRSENADGPYFAARVVGIGGVSGMGATREEALASVERSFELWLDDAIADGLPIPEPTTEGEFSGQFRLRVPKAIHRDLTQRADQEGVSLNTWCASVLAQHGT